jgi:hypothetical protein
VRARVAQLGEAGRRLLDADAGEDLVAPGGEVNGSRHRRVRIHRHARWCQPSPPRSTKCAGIWRVATRWFISPISRTARADPALIWEVNVEGTRRVAERAAAAGVRRLIY